MPTYTQHFNLPKPIPGSVEEEDQWGLTLNEALDMIDQIVEEAGKTPVVHTGAINVADFGAVGDGVTDDSDAFRDALAAATEMGDTITSPPGMRHAIASTVIISRSVRFEGIKFIGVPHIVQFQLGADEITFNACDIDLTPNQESSAAQFIYGNGRSGFSFTNCHMYGGRHGIWLRQCNDVLISGNHMHGSDRWHLMFVGGAGIRVIGNYIHDGLYDGVKLSAETEVEAGLTEFRSIIISNNIIHSMRRDGVDMASNNAWRLLINGNVIYNCGEAAIEMKTFDQAGFGDYRSSEVVVSNNILTNGPDTNSNRSLFSFQTYSGTGGIEQNPAYRFILNNNRIHIYDQGIGTTSCVRLGDSKHALIEGNYITSEKANGNNGMFRLHYANDTVIRNNVIAVYREYTQNTTFLIYATNQENQIPMTGLIITENYLYGRGADALIWLDGPLIVGTRIFRNWVDVGEGEGQYLLRPGFDSVDTVLYENYHRPVEGPPDSPIRGTPGDVRVDIRTEAGVPERWVCTVAGNPGTWAPIGQKGMRTFAESPLGEVAAFFPGEEVYVTGDSTFWKAFGLGVSNWRQISEPPPPTGIRILEQDPVGNTQCIRLGEMVYSTESHTFWAAYDTGVSNWRQISEPPPPNGIRILAQDPLGNTQCIRLGEMVYSLATNTFWAAYDTGVNNWRQLSDAP